MLLARLTRQILLCAALGWSGRALAEVTVRAGEHDTFTRIVFTLPKGMSYTSQRLGDLLVLTFPDAGAVPGLKPPPAHVLSVAGGSNQAAIGITTDRRLRVWQIDQRVVVDVFADATPPKAAH